MKNYHKFAIAVIICMLLTLLTFISCTHLNTSIKTDQHSIDSYALISLNSIVESCVPVEKYAFPVFGIQIMSFRLKDCIGVEDMFMVVWSPKDEPKLTRAISNVLVLMYINSENKGVDPTMPLLRETFIKHSTLDDGSRHSAIYLLDRVALEE